MTSKLGSRGRVTVTGAAACVNFLREKNACVTVLGVSLCSLQVRLKDHKNLLKGSIDYNRLL